MKSHLAELVAALGTSPEVDRALADIARYVEKWVRANYPPWLQKEIAYALFEAALTEIYEKLEAERAFQRQGVVGHA